MSPAGDGRLTAENNDSVIIDLIWFNCGTDVNACLYVRLLYKL